MPFSGGIRRLAVGVEEVREVGVENVVRGGLSGRFFGLSGADMRGLWREKSLAERRKGRGGTQSLVVAVK